MDIADNGAAPGSVRRADMPDQGSAVLVRGMDCVDGTPLVDLKPDRTLFIPIAPPQPGDFETG